MQVLDFILYFMQQVFWISVSVKYIYSVRCSCISVIRIHLKISEQLVKIGIFPIPITCGRDSGFHAKSGEFR